MYDSPEMPLWKQWIQACDFFDDDLESGHVVVLLEMTRRRLVGHRDRRRRRGPELRGWFVLLADVARRAADRFGASGLFTAEELAAVGRAGPSSAPKL